MTIIALAVWAIALGVAVYAIGALLYGFSPERVREVIEQAAPTLLGHEVAIGRLEGGLLRGVVLDDVRIRPRGASADTADVLVAKRLSLRLDRGASFRRGALVLAEATVEGVTIEIARDEARWRLRGWGLLGRAPDSEPTPPLPFAIQIASLRVIDSTFVLARDVRSGLEPVRGRLDGELTGLHIAADGRIEWPSEARAELTDAVAGWRGVDLGRGRLAVRIAGPAIAVDTVELDGGTAGGASASGRLGFDGPLSQPQLRVAELRVATRALDIGAFAPPAADTPVPPAADTAAPAAADTAAPAAEDDPAAPTWTKLDGELDLVIRDRAPGEPVPGFDFALRATLAESSVLGIPFASGTLAGEYRTGLRSWRVDESSIALDAGLLEASGAGVALRAERVDAAAKQLDLSRLPEALRPAVALAGRADLSLALAGDLAAPGGTLGVRASRLRVASIGPSRLDAKLAWSDPSLVRLEELDWKFDGEAGRFAGTALRTRGPAELDRRDGALAVKGLDVDWTGGAFRLDGGLRGRELLPTRLDVDGLDVSLVSELLGLADAPGGRISGTLDASGDRERPLVRGELDWSAPRYRGLAADHIALAVGGDEERQTLAARMRVGEREPLRLLSAVPRSELGRDPRRWLGDPAFEVELDADGFELVWLAPLLATRGLEPAGRLDGKLVGAGSRDTPSLRGELLATAVRLDDADRQGPGVLPRFGPLSGTLRFAGERVSTEDLAYGEGQDELVLDAAVAWAGPRARDLDLAATLSGVGFRGRASLDAALRADAIERGQLIVEDLDVIEVVRRAGSKLDLAGSLFGELTVAGRLAEPSLDLRGGWREPRIGGIRGERIELSASSKGRSVVFAGGLDRAGRRVLAADGQLPLDRRAPLASWLPQLGGWTGDADALIAVEADELPLDWLRVLAPRLPVRTDGLARGRLLIRGGPPALAIDGQLTVEQAVLSLATRSARIGPLSGTVEFAGQTARSERMLLASSRGRAWLGGEVHWDASGVDRMDVRADFERYRFDQLGVFKTTLDGSLVVSGRPEAPHLGGELRLDGIRVAFPNQQDPVLKEIRVLGLPESGSARTIRETAAGTGGLGERSTADVTVTLPRGTWVRGIGLDAEVVGEVHITKAPFEPFRYLGRIQVEDGRYTVQGKRFLLDSGVAVWSNETQPIPDIDIQAHREASRDVTVFVQVTGPADRPTLELTSDPPMDPAEIISYLYFGRSATVGNREGRGMEATAATMAGSMLLNSVAPEVRETLRIDEIKVTSGEGADAETAIEIESQVTPDVYVRLIQSLGASADEAVEVRWRFWRGFSVRSRVSRSGASAADLLWEFDYWGLERMGLRGFTPPPPPYRAEPERAPDTCRPPLVCPEPDADATPSAG